MVTNPNNGNNMSPPEGRIVLGMKAAADMLTAKAKDGFGDDLDSDDVLRKREACRFAADLISWKLQALAGANADEPDMRKEFRPRTFSEARDLLGALRVGLDWFGLLVPAGGSNVIENALQDFSDAVYRLSDVVDAETCGCGQALMAPGRAGCQMCEHEVKKGTTRC